MSQISPPIRILLVAAIAFMAAWFLFLRPGGAEPVTPAAPASGLGNAVDGANGAAATANAGAAKASAQTTEPAAAPATQTGSAQAPAGTKAGTTAAKPDAQLGLPRSVAKAVAEKKTLVMLFWNKRAYDDQAVRRELRHIDRRKGKVQVHVASITNVARYASITRGVNLEQSPTVVVVKGDTADALVGYVDAGSINQSISDVMRSGRGDLAGGPSNPYLAAVNDECLSIEDQLLGTIETAVSRASIEGLLTGAAAAVSDGKARLAKLNAPKKYRAFKRDFSAYLDDVGAVLRASQAELKTVTTPAQLNTLIQKMASEGKRLDAGMKAKYGKLKLNACFQ